MKRSLLILIISAICLNFTQAQRWKLKRYEAIVGLGTANVFGDIGGSDEIETLGGMKDYKIKDTRPSLYLGARYRIAEEQCVKLNIISGMGGANDEGSINENREHSFSTLLFEPSLQYEYYFLPEDRSTGSSAMYSKRGMLNSFSMISVYAFAGVGGVLYVPNFKNVHPLEYQTAPGGIQEFSDNSAGFSPVIPVGLGIKYALSSDKSLNFEMGRRFTFTDYIDGFHTNISNANDVYYFATLSVLYKLTTTRRGIPILFEGGKSNKSKKGRPRSGKKPIGF